MNQQQHPSLPPSLSGAVNLDDPVQKCINSFKQTMLENHGVSVVIVGLTADKNVALAFHAPGGLIEALGMLTAASHMIGKPQQ